MCGIFSIVSFGSLLTVHNAGETLIDKGVFLEYRGSQSVGMAIRTPHSFFYEKVLYKSEKLRPHLEDYCRENNASEKTPLMGIVHTRWPTSGVPSILNAQPMQSDVDGEFTLVLNGTITNADELREQIEGSSVHGGKFRTDTDTEVVARLFYEIYQKGKRDNRIAPFEEICKQVTDECQGLYAIAVISKHYPEEIVAYASQMMLCLGFSDEKAEFKSAGNKGKYFCQEGDYFEFSSDSRILTEKIKGFYKLERGDIVKISRAGVLLDRNIGRRPTMAHRGNGVLPSVPYNNNNGELNGVCSTNEEPLDDLAVPQLTPGIDDLAKKGDPVVYKYEYCKIEVDLEKDVMLREIKSQSKYLPNIINKRLVDGQIVFEELEEHILKELVKRKRFYFVGCGSSYNVGLSVKQAFTDFVGAETSDVLNAAMLVDQSHQVAADDSVYIFISQSGNTADTNIALEYCLERGALCIALTNTRPSLISDACHATIDVMAGFERAIASTKAYTCQYLQLCLLAALLGQRKLALHREFIHTRNRKITCFKNFVRRYKTAMKSNPALHNGGPVDTKNGLRFNSASRAAKAPSMTPEKFASFVEEVRAFPGKVESALTCDISELVRYMTESKGMCLFLLSRGLEYATAVEAGLKVSEVTQINTRVLYSSELMHGPLASINDKARVIMIEPSDPSVQMKLRGAVDKVITTKAVPFIICTSTKNIMYYKQKQISYVLMLPETHYLLQGIISAIPFQLSAHFTCENLGNSSDVLPNLAKCISTAV